ncbi:glycosyltransferase family 4 protein [soil metagenome]
MTTSFPRRRLRILTWHVHGNYLYYLTQVPHDFYLVTDTARSTHHTGRVGSLPWGDNVHEAPAEALHAMQFDLVLHQSRDTWEVDRHRWLSDAQRRLPTLYIEHDPPQEHPSDTLHWAASPEVMLVHVTPFNALMWNSGASPVRVVDHGVRLLAEARYTGERASGIVVVNNLDLRGRRLGSDIFAQAAARVPLVLVGMGAERSGGEGEERNAELPARIARHRFFFNPIRYTSLGLAVIEAMMVGAPVVGLATTELVTVIDNGRNGIIDTRVDRLIDAMQELLRRPDRARELGQAGRRTALERFGIERFVDDWLRVFDEATA